VQTGDHLLLGLAHLGDLVVGGVTRLTESGLSITEWKPIAGIVPPASETDVAVCEAVPPQVVALQLGPFQLEMVLLIGVIIMWGLEKLCKLYLL
jgi:hypothetical protein